jgi:hypothetical protein
VPWQCIDLFHACHSSEEFEPFAIAVSRATNDVDETVRALALQTLEEKKFKR